MAAAAQTRLRAALAAHRAGQLDEAAAGYRGVLDDNPDHADALHLLGLVRHQQARHGEARRLIERAIASDPQIADYHNSLGAVHEAQNRLEQAAANYRRAVTLDPGFAKAHNNLGSVRRKSGDTEGAKACFERALALRPDFVEAIDNLGVVDLARLRLDEAVSRFRKALDLCPDYHRAYFNLLAAASQLCDWRTQAALLPELSDRLDAVASGAEATEALLPLAFSLPYFCADRRLHRRLLGRLGSHFAAQAAARDLRLAPAAAADRLRLGYLSADFGDHPIGQVTRPVLALHDRTRFEVIAYALARRRGQQAIADAADRLVDLSDLSAEAGARRINADGVHVLVDLGGYMRHGRPLILALRPAPVQVYWLGHGGGLGAPYIDYLIGDPVLTPPAEDRFYVERIARLPDSFSNADRHRISRAPQRRTAQGLPEGAIVLAGFNNPLKIDAETFAAWMEVMAAVPDSVLWLTQSKYATAGDRLRAAAAGKGIEPHRLVFAERVADKAAHLARHRLADLFLDSFKFNASTTALDALWAGLPVLTCRGATFTGRIAASYLTALDMPELIADSPADFVRLAIHLASDRAARAAVRDKLAAHRRTKPLFDTARFVRHLESAYSHMWRRYHGGGEAASFEVPAVAEPAVASTKSQSSTASIGASCVTPRPDRAG